MKSVKYAALALTVCLCLFGAARAADRANDPDRGAPSVARTVTPEQYEGALAFDASEANHAAAPIPESSANRTVRILAVIAAVGILTFLAYWATRRGRVFYDDPASI